METIRRAGETSTRGVTLIESMVGLVILQLGALALLFGMFSVTRNAVRRECRVEAGYLANYLLAEIMAKEYSSVYDPDTSARGTNGRWDDLGYDRTPLDVYDTDTWDLLGVPADEFTDFDGVRNEPSLGEGDSILSRREWDDVDDYHGFVWGPNFDDEWGVSLGSDFGDYLATVEVDSVDRNDHGRIVAWNASTGAKIVRVTVTHMGKPLVFESGVKLEKIL